MRNSETVHIVYCSAVQQAARVACQSPHFLPTFRQILQIFPYMHLVFFHKYYSRHDCLILSFVIVYGYMPKCLHPYPSRVHAPVLRPEVNIVGQPWSIALYPSISAMSIRNSYIKDSGSDKIAPEGCQRNIRTHFDIRTCLLSR